MVLENNSSRNPGQKDARPGKGTSRPGINPRNSSSSAIGIRLVSDIDKMLASRYELKYHISEAQACVITEYIKPYLHLDRYSTLRPDH
ncbi:MAG: hypothetical protein NTX52_04535, partial [Planctomycetota bacterium]|nr:hypothetical protein [Planctomycetota bacterium]